MGVVKTVGSQAVWKDGRAGGQTLVGAVQSGGDLTLLDNLTSQGGRIYAGPLVIDRTAARQRVGIGKIEGLAHDLAIPLDTEIPGAPDGVLSVLGGVLQVGGALVQPWGSMPVGTIAVILPSRTSDRLTVGPLGTINPATPGDLSAATQLLLNVPNTAGIARLLAAYANGQFQFVVRTSGNVGVNTDTPASAEGAAVSLALNAAPLVFTNPVGWEFEGGVASAPALNATPGAFLRLKRAGMLYYFPGYVASAAPPNAPSGLTATAVSPSQINLTWVDNSTDETSFRIERGTDGVTFVEVASTGPNVTSASNTSGLSPSTTYYYRVRARSASGDSAYSNTASATTQGAALPLDTFTRSDGSPLGQADSGQGWDEWNLLSGNLTGWGRAGNQAAAFASGLDYTFRLATLQGLTATGTFQVTLAVLRDLMGFPWRWNATAPNQANTARTGYLIQYELSNAHYSAYYWNGTGFEVIQTDLGGLVPASGDILQVILAAATPKLTIKISQNGGASFVTCYTSAGAAEAGVLSHNLTSIQHGLITQSSATFTEARWDDWKQLA